MRGEWVQDIWTTGRFSEDELPYFLDIYGNKVYPIISEAQKRGEPDPEMGRVKKLGGQLVYKGKMGKWNQFAKACPCDTCKHIYMQECEENSCECCSESCT